MRFTCQVEVYNRLCPSAAQTQSRRQKSTLTIGGYGSSNFGGKLWILHQTAQNGSGVRYKVNSNIMALFTKFLHEGKITVRFREPAVDLRIMGDAIQIGQFVETIRHFFTGKSTDPIKKMKVTNLEVAHKKKPAPQKKLTISTLKDFRSAKGSYPSSLEQLYINNVNLETVEPKIFRLQHLKVLNLEGNQIRLIPKCIDLLSGLTELYMADNKLGLSTREEDWEWMRSERLSSSLNILDLRNNEIVVLPNCLVHLKSIKFLYLDGNKLKQLPNNLGFVKTLRTLNVKGNSLCWLPASLLFSSLEDLDVSENQYFQLGNSSTTESSCISLKDSAARAVLISRLTYNDTSLPRELIRYLESACYCLCSKATFPSTPLTYSTMKASALANHVVYDEQTALVTLGYRECSVKCKST